MKKSAVLLFSGVAKTLCNNPFLAVIEIFTYLISYLSFFFVLSINSPMLIYKFTDPFTGEKTTRFNDERFQSLLICLVALVLCHLILKILLNAVSENEKDTAAIYYLSGGSRKKIRMIWFLQNEFFVLVAMILGVIISIPLYNFLDNELGVLKNEYALIESFILMLVISLIIFRHISRLCKKIRFVRNLR